MNASLYADRHYTLGAIDRRIYGSFIEHLGRAVYGGIYDPASLRSTSSGFRTDVLDLVKQIGVPVVRYPGGNFVSGYRWEDGVGPRDLRPTRLEQAWFCTENNHVGINEFVDWAKLAETEIIMAVNLGTRGAEEARALVEYCNHPSGSYYSDLRVSHGYKNPHGIKYWCLGNEMDGPWQIGHKTAEEYGRLACETAKLMKWVDPSIELVACGSSTFDMPSFGYWESTVLEHTYEQVDYISLHMYRGLSTWNNFAASARWMDTFIKSVAATCDHVKSRKKSRHTVNLSFDEWNVWYQGDWAQELETRWQTAPHLLEQIYTMEDAVVFGSMLITLLNNADRVKIACLAQLVNVIAPIMVDENGSAWFQTIFYPYLHASQYGKGEVIKMIRHAPMFASDQCEGCYLESTLTYDEATGTATLLAVNLSQDEAMGLNCDLRGLGEVQCIEHTVLNHSDRKAQNGSANPHNVQPRQITPPVADDGMLDVTLLPLSWNMLRFVVS